MSTTNVLQFFFCNHLAYKQIVKESNFGLLYYLLIKKMVYPCLHFKKSKWRQKFISTIWTFIWWRWTLGYFWCLIFSMLVYNFIRNNPKFISTKWKFKWWRWTFASTSIFRSGDKSTLKIKFTNLRLDFGV